VNSFPLAKSEIDHKTAIVIMSIDDDLRMKGKMVIIAAGNKANTAGNPTSTNGIKTLNWSLCIKRAFDIQWIPTRWKPKLKSHDMRATSIDLVLLLKRKPKIANEKIPGVKNHGGKAVAAIIPSNRIVIC
jgi:hypothetical protein